MQNSFSLITNLSVLSWDADIHTIYCFVMHEPKQSTNQADTKLAMICMTGGALLKKHAIIPSWEQLAGKARSSWLGEQSRKQLAGSSTRTSQQLWMSTRPDIWGSCCTASRQPRIPAESWASGGAATICKFTIAAVLWCQSSLAGYILAICVNVIYYI